MGTGSTKINRQVQVPSPTKIQRRSPTTPLVIRSSNQHRRPHSVQTTSWLARENTQLLQTQSAFSHYGHIWEENGKLSSTFEQLIRSGSTKIEHEQKETRKGENVSKHSSTYETALVQSTLTSQFESIHTLSTSERLDTLILNLKQIQLEFDDSVKRRIGQITTEAESILAQIVEETQLSQQELLIQAKEQQTIEDEQYRILLEDFIQKLDEKRAQQLSFIQEQLQQQRLQIFNQSEMKIRALNEQANSLKTNIMSQEERKASEKIDSIVNEINTITTESALQNIGAEIKTNINLTVVETVGSSNTQTQHDHNSNKQQYKRTTYIEENSRNRRRSSNTDSQQIQTKSIHKLAKQNPTNPKTTSQQT